MTTIGELFDAGAGQFERLAPALWNPMANAVVAAADLRLGQQVLDACCGSGASTIPAAQEVGPAGRIDAVDLSAGLLDLAAAKAAALDLRNVTFSRADAATWTADEPYDAVLCCYGLFFLEQMESAARHLAGQLRPGGRFAMSTWQQQAHEPFASLIREACLEEQPSLRDAPISTPARQIADINSAEKLSAFLERTGFSSVEVNEVALEVPLDPELAWTLVLGTGYRFMLPSSEESRGRVREKFLASLGGNLTFNADSLIAVATR